MCALEVLAPWPAPLPASAPRLTCAVPSPCLTLPCPPDGSAGDPGQWGHPGHGGGHRSCQALAERSQHAGEQAAPPLLLLPEFQAGPVRCSGQARRCGRSAPGLLQQPSPPPPVRKEGLGGVVPSPDPKAPGKGSEPEGPEGYCVLEVHCFDAHFVNRASETQRRLRLSAGASVCIQVCPLHNPACQHPGGRLKRMRP